MNVFDPLEAELRELTPRGPSPTFQRTVVARLHSQTPVTPPTRGLWVACALAAACLMAIILWQEGLPGGAGPAVIEPSTSSPFESVAGRPTVLAYRRLLARSPNALDAVLQQDSATMLPTGATFYAFRPSDVERLD